MIISHIFFLIENKNYIVEFSKELGPVSNIEVIGYADSNVTKLTVGEYSGELTYLMIGGDTPTELFDLRNSSTDVSK